MKTIIEIYDDEPIFNVLAASVFEPQQIVFIGGRKVASKKVKNKIVRYIKSRGSDAYAYFYPVNVYSCDDIMAVLSDIVSRFPDCAIDVTGGGSVMIFAVGMFSVLRNVPVFAYNRRKNSFYSVFGSSGAENAANDISITVEQFLTMAGGQALASGRVSAEDIDSESAEMIRRIWALYLANHEVWSKNVQYLQAITPDSDVNEPINAPLSLKLNSGKTSVCYREIMEGLEQIAAIKDLAFIDGKVHFCYGSRRMRQFLCDVGIWLELYVYLCAKSCCCFDDVQVSVLVDWNGIVDEAVNTINEIDVVLTKGIVPIFISCKTGIPSTTSLNEISTLTKLFGGKFAKGVIVTMCRLSEISPAAYRRAADMGIEVIQFDDLNDDKLVKRLKNIAGIYG